MGIIAAFALPHPPLLIPGVGDSDKLAVQKTHEAYTAAAAQYAECGAETLVILSPHAPLYRDYFQVSSGEGARGSFASFGAPEAAYSVSYDEEFVRELAHLLEEHGIPGGTEGQQDATLDHGVMVPLHYFGKAAGNEGGAGNDTKVVRIGLSGLSRQMHCALGQAIAETAQRLNRKTVIIASGDLSHKLKKDGPYGYVEEGPLFDQHMCAALASGSVQSMLDIDEALCEAAAECGYRSFLVMSAALEASAKLEASAAFEESAKLEASAAFEKSTAFEEDAGLENSYFEPQLLSYEGPYGVGYAVASYRARWARHGESLPVALAREALASYFTEGKRPSLDSARIQSLINTYRTSAEGAALYESLVTTCAGAFVSLHKEGELRGCIGTIVATQETVLSEIVKNAMSAAFEDPRFAPLEQSELANLNIKVDILGEAEPVSDRSALDAERYGVIVSLGMRRGLLLPALEGVDTPEEQIAIALAKAGIGANEAYELERFEVVRYT